MMSLLELETEYCKSFGVQSELLIKLYDEIMSSVGISLEAKEITKAILLRMKAYYTSQEQVKGFLKKRRSQAASDFFVETIAFYMKLILGKNGLDYEVWSERPIGPKRGSIRPDISVWDGDQVVAIIECKTQLGYNRYGWEREFHERESNLKRQFPKANAFLVVMTSENWSGFPNGSKDIGKKYFTLCSTWPASCSDDSLDKVIINPFEDLLNQILWVKKRDT